MRRALVIIIAIAAIAVAVVTGMKMAGMGSPAVVSAQAPAEPDPRGEPLQSPPASPEPFSHVTSSALFTLTPLADYDVSALVVGVKRYRGGWMGELALVDLALAWGRAADSDVLPHITFTQSGRWYYFKFDAACPLTSREITEHSANTHTIPANTNVAAALRALRRGDRVRLTGQLVRVDGKVNDRPVTWTSSLTRHDTGNNSCELLYVREVQSGGQIYH